MIYVVMSAWRVTKQNVFTSMQMNWLTSLTSQMTSVCILPAHRLFWFIRRFNCVQYLGLRRVDWILMKIIHHLQELANTCPSQVCYSCKVQHVEVVLQPLLQQGLWAHQEENIRNTVKLLMIIMSNSEYLYRIFLMINYCVHKVHWILSEVLI